MEHWKSSSDYSGSSKSDFGRASCDSYSSDADTSDEDDYAEMQPPLKKAKAAVALKVEPSRKTILLTEIFEDAFLFLRRIDLECLQLTCRRFRSVVEQNKMEAVCLRLLEDAGVGWDDDDYFIHATIAKDRRDFGEGTECVYRANGILQRHRSGYSNGCFEGFFRKVKRTEHLFKATAVKNFKVRYIQNGTLESFAKVTAGIRLIQTLVLRGEKSGYDEAASGAVVEAFMNVDKEAMLLVEKDF
ncbi:hypothetical protein AAVH_20049 [Aphelenchoides avenae]|nr:hypothetical protein AAVH_20049 [Aphelenchus avenae]